MKLKKVITILAGTVFAATFSCNDARAAEPLNTWHNRTLVSNTNYLIDVVYGTNRFVAVGYNGTVLYSDNGTTWNAAVKVTTKDLRTVTYANGLFVAGGSQRTIITSPDGITWTLYPGSMIASLFCSTYGNGKYVFGGTSQIIDSTNGEIWFPHAQPFEEVLDGLTFGAGKFVGVGYNADTYAPALFTSTNAIDWTPRNPQVTESLESVTYGGGQFVAVGDSGTLTTSPDGITWTPHNITTTNILWDVVHGNNTFVTVGWAGAIFSSTNGANWTPRNSGTPNAFYAVTYGNNTFVAVGRFGTIMQSAPVATGGNGGGAVTLSNAIRNGTTFSFQFSGNIGQTYQVQASTNLINWVTLTNLVCTNSPTGCVLGGQTMPGRYYRVLKP